MRQQMLAKAEEFATGRHAGQKRDFSQLHYVVHPIKVAQTVKNYTNDINLIAAALLHDTIEDTRTTYEELIKEFNKKVAGFVLELTNDKTKIQELGKAVYLAQKMNKMSGPTLLVKLADRLDNISDIPKKLDDYRNGAEFARKYINDTIYIMKNLRRPLNNAHIELIGKINETVQAYSKII